MKRVVGSRYACTLGKQMNFFINAYNLLIKVIVCTTALLLSFKATACSCGFIEEYRVEYINFPSFDSTLDVSIDYKLLLFFYLLWHLISFMLRKRFPKVNRSFLSHLGFLSLPSAGFMSYQLQTLEETAFNCACGISEYQFVLNYKYTLLFALLFFLTDRLIYLKFLK